MLRKYRCEEAVFTSSCTDAITMASIILDLLPGDEVIIPAYTFISVGNAFANRGILIKVVDSQDSNPNIDPVKVKSAINHKTRAVVFMSYAGQSEGIEEIRKICDQNNLWIIEDAAHSFDAKYKDKFIGTYGHLATFSFHETKTVHCGQGGMLLINDPRLVKIAKSIEAHGSNKADFQMGLIAEYNWITLGAEFNLSELNMAFLYQQLGCDSANKGKRKTLWQYYYSRLKDISFDRFTLPEINFCESNYYIFFLLTKNKQDRDKLITFLDSKGIQVAFHYTGLNRSEFYKINYGEIALENSDMFSQCLVRLPLYPELSLEDIELVCNEIQLFYEHSYHETLV
jgi:dTDP-4-amino-4,6-dideoxygalactose transaminase